MSDQKYFVLDTNVLLHNADSLNSFADNYVVLPMTVIEELDKFKRHNDELGRNARHVIRQLDKLRIAGSLKEGVSMENGGILKITVERRDMPGALLDMSVADNRILAVANSLHEEGHSVIFVSKDINARLKADALGIDTMDFEKQKCNVDDLYTGWRQTSVPSEVIDRFYTDKNLDAEGFDFYLNEFILLQDEGNLKHSALGRATGNNNLTHLNSQYEQAWSIHPRSKEQRMALELLLDPEISLVTMIGQAGTGKTLLALAAGLECVIHRESYERLLVSRPVIPMGKDIGYLPGTKDEKLTLWMQPIFDNLTYLMRHDRREEDEGRVQMKVDNLLKTHQVELEALTYIRGRSIPRQFVIVDEAQNLTPHEVKTIISRAGENTKMVFTGDPQQIDNPYLDSASNGLSYAVEKLKGHSIYGHITLNKSERSPLSAIAADYL
ncbi:PhoH family protein [Desulfocapsa sulfexigens DSM 10523]|uniref:PhoH family protein n=1 Tax=Desulfocapsa sulfexigens (strain DSM 10523 / SB164P1) TaxID=1167006 RepID=M1PNS7_DESSD|nr:PhoH family protein [Desulfocapsa sulfexigens]AGF78066.1 PhoH family protein [Desulfocapsa sulfexigens DSM 10523]